ncbi:Lsr2 dimerization domain-containing protein [Glutamicibacter ardleyensis]|uniref:Lsr2 dimerization domain-containing protein n=1 Tax=Glutamicibacter ardleyensis TaxID=225894 RepID=UPI003FD45A3E
MALIRVSDISGDRDAHLTMFSIKENRFEIDLTNTELEKLKHDLGKFLDVARKQFPATAAKDFDAKDVRAWAKDNGIEMNPQGRIPKSIIEQWRNR